MSTHSYYGIIGPTLISLRIRRTWSPSIRRVRTGAGNHESKKRSHSVYVLCIPFSKFPVHSIEQTQRVPSVSSTVVRDFSSITRKNPPLSHAKHTREREKKGDSKTHQGKVSKKTKFGRPASHPSHNSHVSTLSSHGSPQRAAGELRATSLSLRVTAAARASPASTLTSSVAAPAPATLSLKGV